MNLTHHGCPVVLGFCAICTSYTAGYMLLSSYVNILRIISVDP